MISDYASLQSAIQSWLWNRADVVSVIPTFIQLAEAGMNRRLQARLSIVRTAFAVTGETAALPADFAGAVSILLAASDGSVSELDFVTPDGLNLRQNGAGAPENGDPDSYTVEGGNFRFYPIPSSSLSAQLTYRQKIPALSNANTANWVLASHPDAYLYGALAHSAGWLRDDARLPQWEQAFAETLNEIQANSDTIETLATNLTPQSGVVVV